MDQFNWIKGLDQSGWVAAALFVVFFIITVFVIVIMLKLNTENKNRKKKSLKKSPAVTSKPARPVAAKTVAKNTGKKKDDSSPLEEAEVFLTYGLNKQAVGVLEKYLKENPSDKTAREMLKKAHKNSR